MEFHTISSMASAVTAFHRASAAGPVRPGRSCSRSRSGPSRQSAFPGSSALVVVSHDYWRNVLGADRNIIGKRVLVNNHPMTVIGVTEAGFRGIEWAESPAIWVPVTMKKYVTPGWGGRR